MKTWRSIRNWFLQRVRHDAGFDVANSVMYGNFDGFPVKALRYHNFPWFTKGAIDFIEESADRKQPFFLYLTPTSLHGPHHAEGLERDYNYTTEGVVEGVSDYNLDVEKLMSEIAPCLLLRVIDIREWPSWITWWEL